jgi:hypothetical protein
MTAMAQTALAPAACPRPAPRALVTTAALFWAREDGFRHASYISAGLFVIVAALKLLSA